MHRRKLFRGKKSSDRYGNIQMKIYMRNAEEYVAVQLGICGELEQGALLARAPFSNGNTYRAIKKLRDARVLIRHRYDDGKKYLRLSSVGGPAYLSRVSPALASNAAVLVNSELQYSGSKDVRLRERANYDVYRGLMIKGIPVNDITCEYRPAELFTRSCGDNTEGRSVFHESGSPFSIEEIYEGLASTYTGLFTKRIIKDSAGEDPIKTGSRTSRITGTLFINGQVYQTYALLDPKRSAWKAEAEFKASNQIIGNLESRSPYYKNTRMENRCILLLESPEHALKMLDPGNKKSSGIDPCGIYSASYVLPSYSFSDSILKLLGTPDWNLKIADALFSGGRHDGPADTITGDGLEVHSFIGCDLNKIRSAMPRLLNISDPAVLLVDEWMRDTVQAIFDRENLETVGISSKELSVIAESIG